MSRNIKKVEFDISSGGTITVNKGAVVCSRSFGSQVKAFRGLVGSGRFIARDSASGRFADVRPNAKNVRGDNPKSSKVADKRFRNVEK